VEPTTGIEPAYSAWKREAMTLTTTCCSPRDEARTQRYARVDTSTCHTRLLSFMIVWAEILPVLISGLLGGGVASVVAPWSNWGVEKRKDDREYRRGLIRSWRIGIAALSSEKEALGTDWYESLRPHLTGDEILKVEGEYVPPRPRSVVVPADPGTPARGRKPEIDLLARAVTRVEREWKL
jgi:hypothetical protein